jgi:hypothetical protein
MILNAGRLTFRMIKFWGFGSRPRPATPPGRRSDRPNKGPNKTEWYAVSLVPGRRCCSAVKAAARRRWLSAIAPRFPLPGCDLKTCECRYQHHADRRAGPRRRADRDALPRQYEGKERRTTRRDRRRPQK